jgi:predicted Zn-dependent protease with MMP-like domain
MMPSDWSHLLAIAESEVNRTIRALPAALREQVVELPVTFERRPGKALQEDGIEEDTLGLFVGEPFSETGTTTAPLPAQVILFLENIRDAAEGDDPEYRQEVRTTLLHELGHYLGLDEIDLDDRGLG